LHAAVVPVCASSTAKAANAYLRRLGGRRRMIIPEALGAVWIADIRARLHTAAAH